MPMSNMGELYPVYSEWSIKGYHVFRVRLHHEIDMNVLPEAGNRYYLNAVKVMLPSLVRMPGHQIQL